MQYVHFTSNCDNHAPCDDIDCHCFYFWSNYYRSTNKLTRDEESEWANEHSLNTRCVWRPSELTCPTRQVIGRTQTAGTQHSGACSPPSRTSLPTHTTTTNSFYSANIKTTAISWYQTQFHFTSIFTATSINLVIQRLSFIDHKVDLSLCCNILT